MKHADVIYADAVGGKSGEKTTCMSASGARSDSGVVTETNETSSGGEQANKSLISYRGYKTKRHPRPRAMNGARQFLDSGGLFLGGYRRL